MGSDDALVLIRVVETLNVVEVRDVKRGDVVTNRKREVGELAVIGYVRIDGKILTSAWAKIEEKLCDTLVSVGVFAEGVDDPNLTGTDGGSESS